MLGAEKVAQCFSQHLSMSLGESRGAQSTPTLHFPNEVHDILHPNVLYDIEWAHGLPDPRQECVIEGRILSRDKGALGQELLDSLQASRIQLSRGKLSSWRTRSFGGLFPRHYPRPYPSPTVKLKQGDPRAAQGCSPCIISPPPGRIAGGRNLRGRAQLTHSALRASAIGHECRDLAWANAPDGSRGRHLSPRAVEAP
jgi:hypothetical protein